MQNGFCMYCANNTPKNQQEKKEENSLAAHDGAMRLQAGASQQPGSNIAAQRARQKGVEDVRRLAVQHNAADAVRARGGGLVLCACRSRGGGTRRPRTACGYAERMP